MFVGGEFYADPTWTMDTPVPFPVGGELTCFLNGGQACLMVIADYLLEHGIRRILLPAYLCPSIVKTFQRSGLIYTFYQVNEDFSIDLDDLARSLAAVPGQAVYFINYFGFTPALPVRDFLSSLRQNGVMVVEDNAQAGFRGNSIGDFVFNSLRKFVPYDGGYLTAPEPLAPYLARYRGRPNRRLAVIREYRERLYRYLFEEEDDHDELEGLFYRAEEYYESDLAVLGDAQEQEAIERLDWKKIRQVRRENYAYLLKLITEIPEMTPIFPTLQDEAMPMGLPVYFSRVSRDRVNTELGNAQIGLSIHWENIHADPRTPAQRLAVEMSNRILTLVIDQRTGRKQIDYLVEQLIRAIEIAKAGFFSPPGL